jgi:hypothetical protein
MKIKIKREGGFIGITSKADLEYDNLTPDEQKTFNALATQSLQVDNKPKDNNAPKIETSAPDDAKSRGLELAAPQMTRSAPNTQMRDAFSYSVSMKKDGKTVSMKFDDMTAPPEIVEIFQKYVQF